MTGNAPQLDESLFALAPVRQIAAHELVLDQIRTAILLGRFQPGEALPPERQLAEFLGVSRMTVREAVAILAGEGILDVRRGRGGGLFVKSLKVERVIDPDRPSNPQKLCEPHHAARHADLRASATPKG